MTSKRRCQRPGGAPPLLAGLLWMSEPGGSALGHALRPPRTCNPLGHRWHQEGVFHAAEGRGVDQATGSRQAVAGTQERGHACVGGLGFGKEVSQPSEEEMIRFEAGLASRMKRSWRNSQEKVQCVLAAPSSWQLSKTLCDTVGLASHPTCLPFRCPLSSKFF